MERIIFGTTRPIMILQILKKNKIFVIIQSFEDFGEYNITPQYEIKDPYEILNFF